MRLRSHVHAPLRGGMTLVELLVVVAIIGASLTVVAGGSGGAGSIAAGRMPEQFAADWGGAHHHAAHGQFPVGCIDKRIPKTNPNGRQLAWSATILPELSEPTLARQVDFNSAYDSAANSLAAATVVPTYLCPSTLRLAAGREAQSLRIRAAEAVHFLSRRSDGLWGRLRGSADFSLRKRRVFV